MKNCADTERHSQFADIVKVVSALAEWVKRPNDFLMNYEGRYAASSRFTKEQLLDTSKLGMAIPILVLKHH